VKKKPTEEQVLNALKAAVEESSLRKVAGELGISHGYLWDIVRGSRPLSEKTKQRAISLIYPKVA
jgi:hypothetical protein